MKKVLFVCNVLSHIYAFHLPYIEWFKQNGYEVHILTNAGGKTAECCDKLYDVGIERSPFSLKNISAYRTAKKIIESEKYDIVHCHTPMGGVIGRLASKTIRKDGAKVLYTAHGFHFYKGASAINWLLYYTMEKMLARKTDCIITINQEDYLRAKEKFESKKTKVEKISGIGVDVKKYTPAENKDQLKNQMGYDGKFLLIYAAEFIPRKNHRFFIDAAVSLKDKCPNVKFLFAGKGVLREQLVEYAKEKGVSEHIDFLGFRTDMPELLKMSDVLVSSSFQEGLAINVIEGLATGLPAVVSNVRGNNDSVQEGINGFIFDLNCHDDFCKKIVDIYSDKGKYEMLSKRAIETAKEFSIENSVTQMEKIYLQYTGGQNV